MLLAYRRTLIEHFGRQAWPIIMTFAVLFLVYGSLGFVLVLFSHIDFVVYWIVFGILIVLLTLYTFHKLSQNK